ncbi:DUF3810 domain-containing protein [Maribacter algicola]|uniref:DUF3810 domain-containing protein n=1 Tax=Meishania litoralis TaxID=3434685 RepID=A0ACC7LPS6_9FLAO
MKNRLRIAIALSILPQVLLVKWMGSHPDFVEKYYSNGLYPIISKFFRSLFGWIPFSFGDIAYFILVVLAVRYLINYRRAVRKRPLAFLINIGMVISVAYFTFHLLWGMNYYRQPIYQKFDLGPTYTKEELVSFTENLIVKTNQIQFQITSDSSQAVKVPYSKKEIFQKTFEGYGTLAEQIPFLDYSRPSLKKSMFSLPLTYMGYGGYLNPFTAEAQVNAKLLPFRFPVVAGHEVGHQLGYSAENETNFIGYLVTVNNDDIYFKYVAYAYALAYCLGEVQRIDDKLFNELYDKLNIGTQNNYKEANDFWASYENPLEPIFKSAYSTFLKANNQADGIMSYNYVVSLFVNYYKKNPL